MEMPASHDEMRSLSARSQSTQVRLEIKSMEIVLVLSSRHEISDEELELIEARYRRALAFRNLEDLFAQGQLDGM